MTIQSILFVPLFLAFLLELGGGVTISGCIANERNALLNFKKSLVDKNSRLASWNGNNCCNWKGVSCNNLTGRVIRLDLRNPYPFSADDEWSLGGHLSSSLLGLKQLNYLDISMNHFHGPIPKFLGFLRNLRYLNLSLAGFHGLIPHHLGNLSRLEYLNLDFGWYKSSNEVNIDDSYWISHLTSLKHLTMKNTVFKSFQNSIEALNMLPNIAELCISFCNIDDFSASLPYVNFTNLSYLDLSDNSMDKKNFPLWISDIKSLIHIDLSYNSFRSIPDALENLTSLQYMDFSFNDFSGALPKALKNLCNLHTLSGRNNNFTDMHGFKEIFSGCLKDSIEHLDLSYSNLNGCLPDSFGEMHKLKTLYLPGNSLFGSIPKSFGEMHKLKTLDLRSNLLFGSIPESFGKMHKLKTLDLSRNLLFGSIPESIGHLEALEELLLPGNKLNGTVPRSIGQLSNLVLLHLDENYLEGVISEVHFTGLVNLKELKLQSNNLIMNVSHDWIPPFKLKVIDIGSCKMGPYFPQWLETQVNLSFLNLSSSNIMDNLPDWFWGVFVTRDQISLDLSNNRIKGKLSSPSMLSFSLFDVSNNSFSGSIQPILGNRTLLFIYLSRNNFSGEIPLSICSTKTLWIDLSSNILTGDIPNCWNEFGNASFGPFHLDFSRNNLYGNIPHSLGALSSLASLHLSYNNLSGSLPITLRNCVGLETLDLGMNNLTGMIPTWVGEDLTYLKILILRSNNFTGNVISNLSKLKELHILDLANNKLTGRIPPSFGNFNAMITYDYKYLGYPYGVMAPNIMEYALLTIKKRDWKYDELLTQITIIDLSFNNLSEQIPKELGNLHGLISLNLSGNYLVGPIPDAFGSMHSLECLDLSRNELSGNIPSTMSTMTALDSLDLSYNDLSGNIPLGSQLQTLSNESYIGNPKLCGFPLSQPCSNKTSNVVVSADEVIKSDYWYVSIALGFVLGSWIFWCTLFLKKKWGNAFFQYIDYAYGAIYVVATVNINRFKRKMGNETVLA